MSDSSPTAVRHIKGVLDARSTRVAIVVSRFNSYLTDHMLHGALDAYDRMAGPPEGDPRRERQLTVVHVPGSFELPVTALTLAKSGDYDAVICLGCVIRGETDHYDHVVEQTAKGIREVGTSTGVPCIFGVITADTVEQALNRAGVKQGNMGANAMMAAVEMAHVTEQLETKDG